MAFRAFFALPVESFTTTTGQHTNAIYGFMTMLVKLVNTHTPTHLLVAFDTSRHSFRTDIYEPYKGGREATPEEFKGQVPLIKQVLDAMGVARLEKDGVEADDLLATVSRQAEAAGMEVLVASGDRDTFQLITEKTKVIYPGRSTSDLRVMDAQAVLDKYRVKPAQYPELAALVGESADNLPGVPLVGEKTAAQWLDKYGDLEGVLAHADDITGKRGENLRAHAEQVRLNRKLNALLRDVEVPLTLEQMRCAGVDRPALEELFDVLEFSSLRGRIMQAFAQRPGAGEENAQPAASASSPAAGAETKTTVKNSDEEVATEEDYTSDAFYPADELKLYNQVEEWLTQVSPETPVALLADASDRDIARLVLATTERAVVLDPAQLSSAEDEALGAFLARHRQLVCHGAKAIYHQVAARGWEMAEVAFDTELAGYILRPEARNLTISALAVFYLDEDVEETSSGGQLSLLEDHAPLLQATQVLLKLAAKLRTLLRQQAGWQLLTRVEIPVQMELFRMEQAGIAVCQERIETMSKELRELAARAQSNAFQTIGREVNLASPQQLQSVLFDQLQMPKTKKTKRGYTTNAEALTQLLAQTDHPFLRYLLEHRDKTKLAQIVDGLAEATGADGRIHTTFQQTVTATGRLSSTQPNLQNIPARTAEGVRIRHAFVPGEGYAALMTADYSQIEMRIMAHMSADQELIAALNSGEDLHRTMAAMVFHVPVGEVTPAQRSRIKATSYGLAYGLSAYGLSQQLRISVPQANELREQYFDRFGGIGRFLGELVEQARERGFTETLLGRRRYLPDLNSSNRPRREMAERAALNAPIQGSAADIIKIAMVDVAQALREADLRSRVLLQVHDELVLELAVGEETAVRKLVEDKMARAANLDVPLEVSIGVGGSWMEAAH